MNYELRIRREICLALMLLVVFFAPIANATSLNPFDPNFKLSICDGPEPPEGVKVPQDYKVCNFTGLMNQAQFLINVMIMLGVMAAIVSMSYGGYLYITGVESNINRAKDIFHKTGWGFVMMLTAWFIVYQLLDWLVGNSGVKTLLGT